MCEESSNVALLFNNFYNFQNIFHPIFLILTYHFIFYFDNSRSEATTDGIVLKYDEHEDSVYGVEWSSADPWVFASLSYDGRMVVGRVPRRIKYQMLLWWGTMSDDGYDDN